MDNLTKAQKDEYATSFAVLALYDGGVSQQVAYYFVHDQTLQQTKSIHLFVS